MDIAGVSGSILNIYSLTVNGFSIKSLCNLCFWNQSLCWTTLGWTGTENMTGNSAIADKPRDEFVQINGVDDLLRYAPPHVTMPNLVLLHSRVAGVNTGEPQNWEALEVRSLGMGGLAQRCTPVLTCATASNLVVLRQRVYTVHCTRK